MDESKAVKKKIKIFWLVTIGFSLTFGILQLLNHEVKKQGWIAEVGGIDEKIPKMWKISPFSFLDRTEKTITNLDMEGKIWVADLIFTSCEGPCPLMTHNMSGLQSTFKSDDDVKFFSLTIDPEVDTTKVLAKYAKSYKAIEGKWYFLTGEKSKIIDFAIKSLKIPADENPDLHSTRFALIDKTGMIRGFYDSSKRGEMEKIKAHIKMLQSDPQT